MKNISKKLVLALTILFFLNAGIVSANKETENSSEDQTEEEAIEELPENDESDSIEASLPNGEAMEVTSNTDENGEVFNPTISFPELEGKKQFLSFKTPENETYHIVVEYGRNSTSTYVYLLKSVKDQEIEAIATNNLSEEPEVVSETFSEETASNEEDSIQDTELIDEASTNEVEKSSVGRNILVFGVVIVTVLGLYFLKKRNSKNSGYDDE